MGNHLFLRDRKWGIDHQKRKSPEVCLEGEGMATGQIEPCIIRGRHLIGVALICVNTVIVSMSLVNSDSEFGQTCQGQM